ncbi:MAG: alpha/beta fold hydrolase, partial [Pyrinomonadaceae bacterium]
MNDANIKLDEAQIGGVRLHYATAGAGDKLVVLLHGFPEFWLSWRQQIIALSHDYTVVAPDMRGYNLSDKPSGVEEYKIEKLVDDVMGLIRHFGREQAAVVGHDWGAAVAWAVAQNHPEAVWKLCAMQIPPARIWRKNQTLKQFLTSWYMFFLQIPKLPEWLMSLNDYAFLADALKKSTAKPGVFTDEKIAEYKRAWSEPDALTAMINYYRANVFSRLLKPQPEKKITVPTLFIYGEKDHAVLPETVAGVGAMIDAPFSEIRIPDSGHGVQQEAAEIVTDAVREFWAEKVA